jgi:ubiquinone biosynthesis protein
VLRRNWLDSPDLYVPEVIWSHTAERALTMERVRGIPSDDIAALDAAGIDRKALAAKGVRVFYTAGVPRQFLPRRCACRQHLGGCGAQGANRASSRWISASWASSRNEDQYYLAENFMAIFNRDYRRIAELHVQAGWMPATSASTNWKPRRARSASRTSPARSARSRWPKCWSSCSAPRSAMSSPCSRS